MNRGQREEPIVLDRRDRERFVSDLGRLSGRFHVLIHGYWLMTNHCHLILEIPEGNLSRAVQWLNVAYAAYYNRRRPCSGRRVLRIGQSSIAVGLSLLILRRAWEFPIRTRVLSGTLRRVHRIDSLVPVHFGSGLEPALQGILTFPGPFAEQHAFDTDILVQIRPVNADSIADQPPVAAFLRCPMQQTRIPG